MLVPAAILMTLSIAIVIHLAITTARGSSTAWSVPTPAGAMPEILAALAIPAGGRLVDLGCGDGRVLAGALHRDTTIKAQGVDYDPMLLVLAWFNTRGKAKLTRQDVRQVSLPEFDRVFVYLSVRMMADLAPHFEKELKPGARVVSLQFPLPQREPTEIVELKQGKAHAQRLFVYDY